MRHVGFGIICATCFVVGWCVAPSVTAKPGSRPVPPATKLDSPLRVYHFEGDGNSGNWMLAKLQEGGKTYTVLVNQAYGGGTAALLLLDVAKIQETSRGR